MLLTAIKNRVNSREWMQKAFVEVVGDIVMILFGLFLVYIWKAYIV